MTFLLDVARFGRVRAVKPDGTLTREFQIALQIVQDRTGGTTGVVYASDISNVPAGSISSVTVQGALNELDVDKQPKDDTLTSLAGLAISLNKVIYGTAPDTFGLLDLDSDTALSANSDAHLPTQKAVKAYADTKQPQDATLTGLAALTIAANELPYGTGADTFGKLMLDADGTLSANSDTRLATQKAVKTYADSLIAASDAMVFKGVIDCSTNPNYPAADRGHTYRVSVAGKIGGASGVVVEVGDILLCLVDGSVSGDQAAVGTNWTAIQTNIDGAVIGPASATDGHVVFFDGTSGKLIKDSGLTLSGTNTGDQTITLTGDVTGNGTGSFAATVGSIGGKAVSLAGSLTTVGAFASTFTMTGVTAVTFPPSGTLATLAGSETFTNKVLTAPDINGGTVDSLTSLSVRSTGTGAFDVTLANNENLTAGRMVTVKLNDASRTIDIAGNLTLAAGFTTAGANALTLTTTGATNVTMPTTGTLSTVAGSETFTNKTLTAPVVNNPTGTMTLSSGVLGYATGNGGTVTQATSKSNGVTLNKISGEITLNNAALASGATVSFTLTNSAIAAGDVLILNHASGGTFMAYDLDAQCGAGSAVIGVRNASAGSLSEAIVIRFAVLKAATS